MKFNFKKILLMIFITFICFYANTKVYADETGGGGGTFTTENWCYYINGNDVAIRFNYYAGDAGEEIPGSFMQSWEDRLIGRVYFDNIYGTSAGSDSWVNSYISSHKESKVCSVLPYYDGGYKEAMKGAKGCPKYVLYRKCNVIESYIVDDINNICYTETSNEQLNFEKFKEKLQARDSSCIVTWAKNVTKDEYVGTFGNFENNFNEEELECKCSEENPDNCLITPEIQDMIDEILMYPRIIVPIILIVTGIYNFAKAAFANKVDEMKKYQKKFFKQLLIGVMFFFIPTLINIIIDLSQYVWDGLKTCSI